MAKDKRNALRNWLEFAPAWLLLKSLGCLPRGAAIGAGRLLARTAYRLHGRLRLVGETNLRMAMPELSAGQRRDILDRVMDGLGGLLGEFSQLPKIRRDNISERVVYDGFENYERAARQGRGVLLLTGHFGAWELCAFAQGVYGHPLSFLVRPLDNPLLDRLIARYRSLSGNRLIDKNDAVRAVLKRLRQGEDVGLLVDVNTVAEEGVFCDFFGIPACSTTGLAVFALRAGAPVVPGFLIWDASLNKHVLRFEPEVPLIRTGDFKEEVRLNTQAYMKVIERFVRRYPEQWLWIHKRWQTRPAGTPDLYAQRGAAPAEPASIEMKAEAR
ncbi:MAG TPA: lysophospholipid acyltransferase family protein [Blastocatellia bacterium]|nr:lysophospholipid acyltransferase family protein [Blastocatellia bacterium]